MNVPDDLRYTTDHEWARPEGNRMRVGITDYAQDALGDVVFVQLPSAGSRRRGRRPSGRGRVDQVGVGHLRAGDRQVVEVNGELADAPQTLNDDPYGEGWICVIVPADPSSLRRCSTRAATAS